VSISGVNECEESVTGDFEGDWVTLGEDTFELWSFPRIENNFFTKLKYVKRVGDYKSCVMSFVVLYCTIVVFANIYFLSE
jgi:hypothetical protein